VSPTLAAQWSTYMHSPSILSAREYLYLHAIFRQPHHLIPSSWPGVDWYRFFLVLAIAAAAGGWRSDPHRRILTFALLIFGLCVIGTVFVEWIPVKLIIRIQTFRLMIFVKLFAVLYAARVLLRIVERGAVFEKVCALAILTIQNFTLIGMAASLIFAVRQNKRWLWGVGLFGAGVVAGIAVVATTSRGIPMFWHSFGISPRGVWVGPATLALVALMTWRRAWLLPGALLSLILWVRAMFGLPAFTYDQPIPDDWVEFSRLIREKTPRDAVILTPPYRAGLQLFAQRAEVVNFKCTPMVERELIDWKKRLDDAGGYQDLRCTGWEQCASALAGGYMRMDENQLAALARKYGAQYVVTAGPKQHLHTPVLAQLYDFKLYQTPR